MCNVCNKSKCCCAKTVSKTGPRGPKGNDGKQGPAGLNGTSSVLFRSSGIVDPPADLSSGKSMCPITISAPGDYVFDFTLNTVCKSSAVDTLYVRTFARKNGINLAAPVPDYIKTTVLPKQSSLGALSSVTHNHKIELSGLIAGDIISFWGVGDAEELSSSMIYIKK